MATQDLPEELQSLDTEERKEFVAGLAQKREDISSEIEALGARRQVYITEERAKLAGNEKAGLDEAILKGIRDLARDKGFEFD